MQRYAVYFIWKLLCMFGVLPPPIIRRANDCFYSIWYLSHCYCWQIPDAADRRLRSWWWVVVLPEICRAVSR